MLKVFTLFFSFLWKQFLPGFILDARKFVEEKKVWGLVYLTAAIVAPFVLVVDQVLLGSIVLVGVSCYLGLPLGNNALVSENLKSLGLFDLVTTFSNKGDPARFFGSVFLATAIAYTYSPLWLGAVTLSVGVFWIFAGGGLLLLFGAAAFQETTGNTLEPS